MPNILYQNITDQVDLLLTRCGYDKHVMEEDEGESFVYRNGESLRQIIVGWIGEATAPEYTLINSGILPRDISNKYIPEEDRGAKHTDADLIVKLFLDLTVVADAAGVNPKHTATALDLFRYHPYAARNQSDGYTEMLQFVAATTLNYKTVENLILTGMPLSEIRAYANLNPALVGDLLATY